jgi:phage protein D
MTIAGPSGQSVDFSSPFYHVTVVQRDGKTLDVTSRVSSMTHADSGKKSTSLLELEMDNADDYVVSQYDIMRKGAIFRVSYGYPNLVRDAGEFVAKEHEGNSKQINIKAYERKRSKMARRMQVRTWTDVTRSFVVRDVLRKQGFDDRQMSITETTTRYPSITQASEDDWMFIQGLADLEGFSLWADEAGVFWKKPQNGQKPSYLFRRARNAVGIGYIKDYSIDSFGPGVPGRIVLKGRDPYLKTSYEVTADEQQTSDLVLLTDSDDIASPDATDRDDAYEMLKNIGMRSQQEAKKLADALFKEYKYNALKLKLTVFGDPTIRTNRVVLVWGIGPTVDGLYDTKECKHSFSGGYSCEISLRRNGLRKPSSKANKEDDALRGLLGASGKWKPPPPYKVTGPSE